MEPITTGALAAAALALGTKVADTATGEVVKDAYRALKAKIANWASSHDVAELEKTPDSQARQAVLAEIIDNRPREDQQLVRELAETIISHLESNSEGGKVVASGQNSIAAGRDVSGNTIIHGNRNRVS
jgi:hypothetical protein